MTDREILPCPFCGAIYGPAVVDKDEYRAVAAAMEQIDPATLPGLTVAQRCALGRFAKPAGGPAGDAQPVAWVAADTLNSPHPGCVSSLAYMSQLDRERGREYVPLYAAPVATQAPTYVPAMGDAAEAYIKRVAPHAHRLPATLRWQDLYEAMLAAAKAPAADGDAQPVAAQETYPQMMPAELSQFLSDVMTAAGLVSHGKQCKALGERLGDACMRLRLHCQELFAAPVAAQKADDNDVVYLGGSAPPIPRWVVDSADRIAKYMDANWPGEWALGRIQSRATQKADDARDAERYRLLRRKVCIVGGKFHILNLDPRYIAPDAAVELDAAIDADIAQQRTNGDHHE